MNKPGCCHCSRDYVSRMARAQSTWPLTPFHKPTPTKITVLNPLVKTGSWPGFDKLPPWLLCRVLHPAYSYFILCIVANWISWRCSRAWAWSIALPICRSYPTMDPPLSLHTHIPSESHPWTSQRNTPSLQLAPYIWEQFSSLSVVHSLLLNVLRPINTPPAYLHSSSFAAACIDRCCNPSSKFH